MSDYDADVGAELCQCGHRLDDHISVEIGTDDVDLCCGRCGCDRFAAFVVAHVEGEWPRKKTT